MKGVELHLDDEEGLHEPNLPVQNGKIDEREIWLDREQDDLLADVHDASMFYGEFPPLLDFPCMSSSSSSSSAPAPTKSISCSSSSSSASSASPAASWVVMKSDAEQDVEKINRSGDDAQPQPTALLSTASMDVAPSLSQMFDVDGVMENFGYMDILESNEIWDPSSIFHPENQSELLQQDPQLIPEEFPQEHLQQQEQEQEKPEDELATVFLEWLKINKESISAEDLRKIKLRRATIECAARRLGGGVEGTKQLLKLILQWVQQFQLQKKRLKEAAASNLNPNFNSNSIHHDSNPCWMTRPPCDSDHMTAMPAPSYPSVVGYIGDHFSPGTSQMNVHVNVSVNPYMQPPASEYHMLDAPAPWPPPQFPLPQYSSFPDNYQPPPPAAAAAFGGYGGQYLYQFCHGNGEPLVRAGSSATKEARKKRMARQRRCFSHHRSHHHGQQSQHQNMEHARIGGDNCTAAAAQANAANWVYWSPAPPGESESTPVVPIDVPQQSYHRQFPSDRRQGWKPEKNLKFLLQKVLKQSDVGSLGRIVLPKKEAETNLPELEARDGISIAMEDIGTSRVWNMRYRFWPNNKSRMYLLENTGDFVRSNGLQEGDFIVIYSDVKNGKYMIRGVKVRQPGTKPEPKRSAKAQRHLHVTSPAGGGSSSAK